MDFLKRQQKTYTELKQKNNALLDRLLSDTENSLKGLKGGGDNDRSKRYRAFGI